MSKISFLSVVVFINILSVYSQNSQVFETRIMKSNILNMERKYSIYLPPGYNDSDRSYPVLYLLHGAGDDHTGWIQFGQVQHIADKTIAEGKAAPMIIVMPDADTGVRGYYNAIDGSFNYEDYFFDEFIPFIEKTYRVRSERSYRAISGNSMGGGGSIFYSLHHPDVFAAAAPLSAATGSWIMSQMRINLINSSSEVSEQQIQDYFKRYNIEDVLDSASEENMRKIKEIRWYITCGDDDFLYEGNSIMHILFRENQVPHEYRVKDGGHSWSYWRDELPIVLEFVSKSFTK